MSVVCRSRRPGTSAGTHCVQQPVPQLPPRPANNTLAIAYWRGAAARARQGGWFDRVFDYTCDEPGADPTRYPACAAHAQTLHSADAELKVMITAEKPSADSVNISSMIDIWAPIINFMDGNHTLCAGYPAWAEGNRRERDYSGLVREGKGLWWYQSCMSEGCSAAVQPAHGGTPPGCGPSPCYKA